MLLTPSAIAPLETTQLPRQRIPEGVNNIGRFKGRDGRWRDKAIAPQDRLRTIVQYITKASDPDFAAYMGRAAVNVATNQIEDFVIGKLASGRVKAYLKNAGVGLEPGKPTGIGLSQGGAL